MPEIDLCDAIRHLREELSRAMEEGKNQALRFNLAQIELELEVELAASASAKAECKWVVISVGGEARGESKGRHKVKLTLRPAGSDPVLIADPEEVPED